MNLLPHNQNTCPYCGGGAVFLSYPKLRIPNSFWTFFKRIKVEHLEVTCSYCHGTFQKRTAHQQSEVDNMRPYNDRNCVACGTGFNAEDSTSHLIERPSTIHGAGAVLAQCSRCTSSWKMRTYEDQRRLTPDLPRILQQATRGRRPSEPVPETPMAEYKSPEPRTETTGPVLVDLPLENKP